jgi:hypothetical protein
VKRNDAKARKLLFLRLLRHRWRVSRRVRMYRIRIEKDRERLRKGKEKRNQERYPFTAVESVNSVNIPVDVSRCAQTRTSILSASVLRMNRRDRRSLRKFARQGTRGKALHFTWTLRLSGHSESSIRDARRLGRDSSRVDHPSRLRESRIRSAALRPPFQDVPSLPLLTEESVLPYREERKEKERERNLT